MKSGFKTKTLGLLALCSITVIGVVTAVSASFKPNPTDAGTYALTLDSSNGKITGAYSTTVQTNSTAQTTIGASFSVSYYNAMASTNSSFAYAQLKSGSGYLYSTYGVKGLISIDVTFSSSGSLYLYTSDSATFSSTQDQSLTSGTVVAVTKNYWKLFAQGNACYIDSIVLTYTCASESTSSSGTSSTTSSSTGSSSSSDSSSGSTSSSSSDSYSLVTSTSQLTSGSNYVLGNVSSGSGYFASTTFGSNNIGQTSGTVTSSALAPSSTTLVLSLGGSTEAWTFLTTNLSTNGYLNATSTTGSNVLRAVTSIDNYAYFSVSFSSDAAVITCTGKSSHNLVRYNSSSSLFSCYTSGQAAVYLYVQGSSGSSSSSSSSSASTSSSTSTSTSTSTSSSTSSSSSSSANYYKPTGDMTTSTFNYKNLNNTQDCDVLPTTGSLNILVLPIELSDYAFSTQTLTDLSNAFNGSGSTDTGYWESLASFYKKSSFGQLNLTYTIANKYSCGYTAQGLYNKNSSDHTQGSTDILRLAVANYKSTTSSTCTGFDSDTNGLIDAVIMVYSCPDCGSSTTIASIDADYELF